MFVFYARCAPVALGCGFVLLGSCGAAAFRFATWAGAVLFAPRRAGSAVWVTWLVVLFRFCCVGVGFLFCLSLVAVVAFLVVVSVLSSSRFSPALSVFVFGFLARVPVAGVASVCRSPRPGATVVYARPPAGAIHVHACPARPSCVAAPAGRLGMGADV